MNIPKYTIKIRIIAVLLVVAVCLTTSAPSYALRAVRGREQRVEEWNGTEEQAARLVDRCIREWELEEAMRKLPRAREMCIDRVRHYLKQDYATPTEIIDDLYKELSHMWAPEYLTETLLSRPPIPDKKRRSVEKADAILRTFLEAAQREWGVELPFGYLSIGDYAIFIKKHEMIDLRNVLKIAWIDELLGVLFMAEFLDEVETIGRLVHEGIHLNALGSFYAPDHNEGITEYMSILALAGFDAGLSNRAYQKIHSDYIRNLVRTTSILEDYNALSRNARAYFAGSFRDLDILPFAECRMHGNKKVFFNGKVMRFSQVRAELQKSLGSTDANDILVKVEEVDGMPVIRRFRANTGQRDCLVQIAQHARRLFGIPEGVPIAEAYELDKSLLLIPRNL